MGSVEKGKGMDRGWTGIALSQSCVVFHFLSSNDYVQTNSKDWTPFSFSVLRTVPPFFGNFPFLAFPLHFFFSHLFFGVVFYELGFNSFAGRCCRRVVD